MSELLFDRRTTSIAGDDAGFHAARRATKGVR
jgi:hypothetical protein